MKSSWIWLNKEAYPQHQKTYFNYQSTDKASFSYGVAEFMHMISFQEIPCRLSFQVSGDTRYRLWINEQFIGTGPASSGGDFLVTTALPWYYADTYTIVPEQKQLRFFAQVQLSPQVLTELSHGQGGFYLSGQAIFPDGSSKEFGTDDTWLVRLNRQYRAPSSYDASIEPDSWMPAVLLSQQRSAVAASIPSLQYEKVLPQHHESTSFSISTGEEYTILFDKIYAGYVGVCANAPCSLDIECFELPEQKGLNEQIIFASSGSFLSFRMHSIGGYRIRVKSAVSGAVLSPYLLFSHYPMHQEGVCHTSDPELNKVYDVCKWTLKICRQSLHLDSPRHQEWLACTGDYHIEALMTAMTFGDMRLAALDVKRTADFLVYNNGRMFHTTYSLIWVQMLEKIYQFTGDVSLLSYCKEALEKLFALFHTYLGENFILEYAPDYMFVDWTVIEGYSMHHPPKCLGQTVLNAFYYKALCTAVQLCDIAKKAKLSGWEQNKSIWLRHAQELKAAFHACFYDQEKALYLDGLASPGIEGRWQPANPPLRHYSRYGNLLAALYDLCPSEDVLRLTRISIDDENDLPPVQPYFMHFMLEGVIKAGLFPQYGMQLLRKWIPMVKECDKGLQEGWIKPEEGYSFDHSHAWGGTPAYHLPLMLTGLQMLESGYKKISLSPCLYGLEYADVKIPTPYGMIHCILHREKAPQISVPAEIEWTIAPT